MKVVESVQSAISYYIPKDSIVRRLAPVALPLFALIGLIFLQYRFDLMSLAGRLFSPETLTDIFNRAIDTNIESRPVLKRGADYDTLKLRQSELVPEQQEQLFRAELLSVCKENGELLDNVQSQEVQKFVPTFLRRNNWPQDIQDKYRSILLEDSSRKYRIHYDDQNKMDSVNIKGQELKVEVIPDNGDCLFLSFIAGLSLGHAHTPESLRILASAALKEALKQPDPEGLMQQLAEGMRMHKEAHSPDAPQENLILQTIESFGFDTIKGQFSNNPALSACANKEDFIKEWRSQNPSVEDPTPALELAQQFCELLVQPRTIYPGEETIKILAESLDQPTVIVNGDALRYFGPVCKEGATPIMIYKTPGNAHYNHLIVLKEQWDALREFCN
jgi:hypothetical protein